MNDSTIEFDASKLPRRLRYLEPYVHRWVAPQKREVERRVREATHDERADLIDACMRRLGPGRLLAHEIARLKPRAPREAALLTALNYAATYAFDERELRAGRFKTHYVSPDEVIKAVTRLLELLRARVPGNERIAHYERVIQKIREGEPPAFENIAVALNWAGGPLWGWPDDEELWNLAQAIDLALVELSDPDHAFWVVTDH